MKSRVARVCWFCVCAVMAVSALSVQAQSSVAVDSEEAKKVVIEVTGLPPAAPVFYTAEVVNDLFVMPFLMKQSARISLHVVQGEPEVLSLEMVGEIPGFKKEGARMQVRGEQLESWSLRQEAGKVYLDLVPKDRKAKTLDVELNRSVGSDEDVVRVLTFGPAKASGFQHRLNLRWEDGAHVELMKVEGCQPVELPREQRHAQKSLLASGVSVVELRYRQSGSAFAPVELRDIEVDAVAAADGKSAVVRLTGAAVVHQADGGELPLIEGALALQDFSVGEGYRCVAQGVGSQTRYSVVFEKAGSYPLDLQFAVKLGNEGGWTALRFGIPHAVAAPVHLHGVPAKSRFLVGEAELVGVDGVTDWSTFLPANGQCVLLWKPQRKGGSGELFFTTHALVDMQLGAGMLRERTQLSTQVLQGKMRELRLSLEGEGEVLALQGPHVGSWRVLDEDGKRVLVVQLNGERADVGEIVISTQSAIGNFPAKVKPLQITPIGAMRHAGYVRLSNQGAVKLGVSAHHGMMQLAPDQFPGAEATPAAGSQVFVYRFPSAERGLELVADQILPEVAVHEVLVYRLSETDRELRAEVELDIREAPLREWDMRIPADYAVASVTSAEMGQMVVGRTVEGGQRSLKVTFKNEVIGRQVISLRLARNAATAAGEWVLEKMTHPQAKSVRGSLGVEVAQGWRVVPGKVDKLVEMPLAYFPQKSSELQQAFRLRDAEWSATMQIQSMEQSVQADVFHLYSLKEGMAYGSVLINYFVVGAPMHEWRIQMPGIGPKGGVGNVMVEGQNVRSWRQDGEQLIVTLHQPTMGGSTLLVSFEQPMSARGGLLDLGKVQPLDAKSESGFIQVVSPTQVKQSVKLASGLLTLGATELPVEYRLMSSAPSLAAWQYATRAFELQVEVQWYAPSNAVEQVVDFASLHTQVSRDGGVVTEAQFFVKTRGRKALEMRLPEGADLLEASAEGKVLTTRKDGDLFLLPLPAKEDPNEPVAVVLRYGGAAENPARPTVGVPMLSAPVVISEWKVSADRGYLLKVVGGNVQPVEPSLTETGFEWLQSRMRYLYAIFALLLAGCFMARQAAQGGWKPWIAALWLALAALVSLNGMQMAGEQRRVNQQSFEVEAAVLSPEKALVLELSNQPEAAAMRSLGGVSLAVLGLGGLIASVFVPKLRTAQWRAAGFAVLALGVLCQHGGAVGFFLLLAVVAAVLLLGLARQWFGGMQSRKAARVLRDSTATALVILGMFASQGMADARVIPPPAQAAEMADVIQQRWNVQGELLTADTQVQWQAKAGESILLLQAPASLTELNAAGARVNKVTENGMTQWFLVAERTGLVNAQMRYQMSVKGLADHPWQVPTGGSAAHRLEVVLDRAQWEISSEQAVLREVLSAEKAGKSQVRLQFSPLQRVWVHFQPMGRDPKSEPLRFFVESADLYLPSPGVVDGWHALAVRPVSGQVDQLVVEIPADVMVGDVASDCLESWRFDPQQHQLSVLLTEPKSQEFSLRIQTQRGMESLPQPLALRPLQVRDAESVVGVLGLAFGNDAQPDALKAQALAPANLSDFHTQLWEDAKKLHPDAVLQKVYRYGKEQANLGLQVDPVAAELREVSKQTLSLGEDRMLLSVQAEVEIVRAGVFELRYRIPDGLEVESISGSTLRDWTEVEQQGARIAVLQLAGSTMGKQTFHLAFSGASPVLAGAVDRWAVPHVELQNAMRQTGELLVVPEQGIRVRVVQRQHVTQLDARQSGTHRKGDLAFRLLQADWQLQLGIERLEPWVSATFLQEVSLREGQTRTRLSLEYEVENAAVKALQLRLPALSAEEAKTVRASGQMVKEMVQVEGDRWELRLRRGVIGKLNFEVEFQKSVDQRDAQEVLQPVALEGVRRVRHFVAVRSSGRLDIRAAAVMGWRESDWSAVPKQLINKAESSVPTLCYLLAEPEAGLAVQVKRHDVAKTLRLRVLESRFTSLFNTDQSALTLAELTVRVVEKDTMRAVLPTGSELFSVTVNGESVEVVSQGSEQLFYVTAGTDGASAEVKLMYRTPAQQGNSMQVVLDGPRLNAPLERIEWIVSLPAGYRLAGHSEGFDLVEGGDNQLKYGLDEYQSSMSAQRQQQVELAKRQLNQANSWISQGDYKKAEQVLSQVSKNRAADAAFNEDARVQLRNLRNQQAVMGLNTRRQKLYLDNKSVGNMVDENGAFEEAANLNPLFQGKENYQPEQLEQLLMGNTAEEREAMQRIADRIVGQQLAAQPAAQTIQVNMPEGGGLLRFSRESQLDSQVPVQLALKIERTAGSGLVQSLWILLCVFVVTLGVLMLRKQA